ncbi:MAG: cyclic nucleotide-binding domain-containing protein [Myxococcales bacterium]|nr:cyclic nucleotide-binding domain-containing protein [Myxococcales bacterium]
MSQRDPQPGFSSLDRAWALRLSGDREGALRLAASVLAKEPAELGAAALLCRCLLDADRAERAGETCQVLVRRHIARGDLPGACYAANLALEAGGYAPSALFDIANAFGKGSTRVSAGATRPPPLPVETDVAPHFAQQRGPRLLAAAEMALAHFAGTRPAVADDAQVPKLPLFAELAPPVLQRFLGSLAVRELPAGAHLAREGEAGQEAFVLVRGLLNVVRTDESAVLAALGPGAIFGEMALVSDAPRTASVVAVEPVVVLSISRAHLEALSHKDPAIGRELGTFCHRRMVSNLILHSPILSAIAPEQRQRMVRRFETRAFKPGERLVKAGQPSQGLWLLASGGVEVRGRDRDGDTVMLASLGPGQVVGEISLVLRRPANADVVAVHPTVALCLSEANFHEAIREHPDLLRQLYELALHREQETRSAVAQRAVDVSDLVLL